MLSSSLRDLETQERAERQRALNKTRAEKKQSEPVKDKERPEAESLALVRVVDVSKIREVLEALPEANEKTREALLSRLGELGEQVSQGTAVSGNIDSLVSAVRGLEADFRRFMSAEEERGRRAAETMKKIDDYLEKWT